MGMVRSPHLGIHRWACGVRDQRQRRSAQDGGILGSRIRSWRFVALSLFTATLAITTHPLTPPSFSAERIYVTYNLLQRSIAVASLQAYAAEGVIDDDLAAYAQYAKPELLKELRTALNAKADVSAVTIAQFLYSPQGDAAVRRLGQVIQPISGVDNGYKAIRAALILAAADPDGLSVLSFLRHYPAAGIKVDVGRSLAIVAEAERLINQSRQATRQVNQVAAATAIAESPLPVPTLDLRQRGQYSVRTTSLLLTDPQRRTLATREGSESRPGLSRTYPVDIYLPEIKQLPPRPQGRSRPLLPVVAISHGLGSDRTSFAYLAEHLASHGFAVLVPEHPGSDRQQLEALLAGVAAEVAEPTEFANRPLDITYLLDELQRNPDYAHLNLNQVGVIGHSFGGYTALTLAGAAINFPNLQTDCAQQDSTFNISLLLQCRALQLAEQPQPRTDFRDPRVQAVIAMNQINSAVLGEASLRQITIPTLILTSSADTVAPSLFEQIQPFQWLTTPDRYLVQMEPGTHFSVIGGVDISGTTEALPLPPEVVGPNPAIAQRYVNAIALAFFQTYIAQRANTFQPYLSATYAQSISEPALRLALVRSLTPPPPNP